MTTQEGDPLLIGSRYHGPPQSGNGGYVAGRLAARLRGTPEARAGVEVTLRAPVPLETPLRLETVGDALTAYDGATLVAQAVARPLGADPVPPVGYDDAVSAASRYPGFVDHPFPTCYVCGPRRVAGEGLRIFPGPLTDGYTAAPWEVPAGADEVTVWAALDCPGGWSIIAPGRPYVLGRITARVDAVPAAGDRCVVVGALDEVEGRKARVRTTVYGPDGAVLGVASAVWIAV